MSSIKTRFKKNKRSINSRKSKRRSTKRSRTKGRRHKGRRYSKRKGGKSINLKENEKKNYNDKKLDLMERGMSWRVEPENPANHPLVTTQNLDIIASHQRMNDQLDYEDADLHGLTFGGRRRRKYKK